MATIEKTRREFRQEVWTQPDAQSGVGVATWQVGIIHEIGADLVVGTILKEIFLFPSDTPTLVSIESRVVTEAARRINSPEYLASVRRRKSTRIKNMLAGLAKKARRDDFEAFTFRVVEEIRELLVQLTDILREGNTREILRQIRDTFLDGGHERYRDSKVRDLVSPLTKLDRNSGPGYAVGVPFCSEGDSLCVVVSRACCPLPLPTKTVCTQPLIVTACPGIKCGGPEFCWLSLPVSASVMSPLKWNAA